MKEVLIIKKLGTMIDQFIAIDSNKSGGEQTKEKIRKSIHQGTGLVLADEPTNHLDSRGREYLMKELRRFDGTVLWSRP